MLVAVQPIEKREAAEDSFAHPCCKIAVGRISIVHLSIFRYASNVIGEQLPLSARKKLHR
jgi:hypothetical protein